MVCPASRLFVVKLFCFLTCLTPLPLFLLPSSAKFLAVFVFSVTTLSSGSLHTMPQSSLLFAFSLSFFSPCFLLQDPACEKPLCPLRAFFFFLHFLLFLPPLKPIFSSVLFSNETLSSRCVDPPFSCFAFSTQHRPFF